jgi:hypothetical protein
MENLVDNTVVNNDFVVDNRSLSYLNETRKWTLFLSILGMVFLGLMLIVSFGFSAIFSQLGNMSGMPVGAAFPAGIFTAVIIVFIIIYGFPLYFLYQYSVYSRKAIETKDVLTIQKSFQYQKSFYKFWGIFTIIILGFYVLLAVITLLTRL